MDSKENVSWEPWEDAILHKYACEKPYKEIASMLCNKTAYDCIHRRVDWLYSTYGHKINREKAEERNRQLRELVSK